MPNEEKHQNKKKWYLAGGIIAVLLIVFFVWHKLPAIACHGMKYEWSSEYSRNYLESLGPQAAGVLFEYHGCFEREQWFEIMERIIHIPLLIENA